MKSSSIFLFSVCFGLYWTRKRVWLISSYFWPFKSSSTEVIFHRGRLPSNQNFQNHFELHLSRPTNVTKQVWLIFSYFKLFRVGVPEAILDVPEAILDVPEAILCKNENKANSAQLGWAGAWAELGNNDFYNLRWPTPYLFYLIQMGSTP